MNETKPRLHWLRFLSRVAFICNLFFLFAALLKWKNFIGDEAAVSYIIIIGYFLAVLVFNPVVNLAYLFCLVTRRSLAGAVPRWLVLINFGFLLLQILYIILFLNDPVNN